MAEIRILIWVDLFWSDSVRSLRIMKVTFVCNLEYLDSKGKTKKADTATYLTLSWWLCQERRDPRDMGAKEINIKFCCKIPNRNNSKYREIDSRIFRSWLRYVNCDDVNCIKMGFERVEWRIFLTTVTNILSICLKLYSPLLDLGRFFSFLILYTVSGTPWTRNQHVARPLPTHKRT
jgi:hypothetical protein